MVGKQLRADAEATEDPITQNLENKSRGSGLELRGGNPEVESLTLFCTNPPYATPSPWARSEVQDSPGHPWRRKPPPNEFRTPTGEGINHPASSNVSTQTRSGIVGSRDRWRRECLTDTEAKAGEGLSPR